MLLTTPSLILKTSSSKDEELAPLTDHRVYLSRYLALFLPELYPLINSMSSTRGLRAPGGFVNSLLGLLLSNRNITK